jgi:hypothetical protein
MLERRARVRGDVERGGIEEEKRDEKKSIPHPPF